MLEPTRSDSQFLRGSDRKTGKKRSTAVLTAVRRLRNGTKEKRGGMRRDECAHCGAYTPQTAATGMRKETGWEKEDEMRKEEDEK